MIEKKRWRELVGPCDWHHLAIILFLPGRPVRLHTHDFPEIFWIERGAAEHHINGETKRLRVGDFVFIRPHDQHYLQAADASGFTLVNLAYHPRLRADLLKRFPAEFEPLLAPGGPLPVRIELSASSMSALRLELEPLSRSANSRLALERFFLGLPALARPPEAAHLPPMPEWLRRACEEVQRPEVFARGAPGLVLVAGRSAEHVARTVRQVFGVTPSDYVNRVRLEYAARQLRVTTRPIADIALDCGINNLSHFFALFRQAFHQTPRAYRLAYHRTVA